MMRNLDIGEYRRIRKNVARKLFNKGRTIYLTPSNVVPSDFSVPCPITNEGGKNFDIVVSDFESYNCGYELGYYTNFWIKRR